MTRRDLAPSAKFEIFAVSAVRALRFVGRFQHPANKLRRAASAPSPLPSALRAVRSFRTRDQRPSRCHRRPVAVCCRSQRHHATLRTTMFEVSSRHCPASRRPNSRAKTNTLPQRWSQWARHHDAETRARIDAGDQETIVNWLLFGTTFTTSRAFRSRNSATPPGTTRRLTDAQIADLDRRSGQ